MNTDPLRILHSEAATSFGGQEQYIRRMMLAMRERGHHLEAVCQPDALLTQRLRDEGFTVHTTFMDGPANFVKSVSKIRRILRQGNFDVLNTHSRRDTIVAGCSGRLAGTPLIVRTRHLANKVGSLLSYTVIPHRVTTASDFVRNHLIERGVPPEYVATVYPAVDLPQPPDQSTLRQELQLAQSDIIVGCVAVMRAQKGHRDLIDAMEPLFRQRPDVHLALVGGGSPVFEEILAYIAAKNIGGRVHMLGARRDVPNLLAGFDIFALATRKEASGTVFVEAGAAGLPVVGTNVDGVPEMMQDGVSGILVPLDDKPALTAALKRLIDEPQLRQQMGEAGLKFCREENRFSAESMAQRAEACYARWLAERKS
ncbi:glycosyltransferase family 1 protein [Candidimonas sp. SYP-B2681]|uniref:glycosyltransferase family 4 protein n=1 Tax=Candidimonas sp. SYP-B2681 TaxID=2497686 RepID=UPI000F8657E0|nr:glycosyltransferase family 4 protein [Candidimonas sp. SYP-B2681]RTZ44427.1 glycosyltransferase family 1 protein [Candidimonas sp. SYP-B2681]